MICQRVRRSADSAQGLGRAARLLFTAAIVLAFLALLAGVGYALFVRDGLINLYALDRELFIRLRADYDHELAYAVCCMPEQDLIDPDRRYRVRTDSVGRRIVETNPVNGIEVLFIGDSNLFGLSLAQGETIADQLVRAADLSGVRIRVDNWAFVGNNSTVGALHAGALIPRERPALVVLSFGPNDATLTPRFVPEMFERTRRDLQERGMPRWRAALRLLGRALRNMVIYRTSDVPHVPMVAPERFRTNLTEIVAAAEALPAAVILLDFFQDEQFDPDGSADWAPYAAAIEALEREHALFRVLDVDRLRAESQACTLNAARFEPQRRRIRQTYRPELLADERSIYWLTTDGGHPNPILAELLAWKILCVTREMLPETLALGERPECRGCGESR